jgi:MraZ protein
LFQGHSIAVLDAKSRIVLPGKFRSKMTPEADNKIVLTRGLNGCLMLYPLDEWERVKKGLMNFNVFNEKERFFMRQFMMYVHECELDSHNRFLLPSQLIEFAHIKKDVLLLGMLQNVEVWDPERKAEYDKQNPEPFESVAQSVTEKILNKSIS